MIGKIFGGQLFIKDEISFINSLDVSEEDKNIYIKDLLSNYNTFKILQRGIALLFILMYVIAIVISSAAYLLGSQYTEVLSIVTTFNLGMIVLTILGFYFTGGAISSFKNK